MTLLRIFAGAAAAATVTRAGRRPDEERSGECRRLFLPIHRSPDREPFGDEERRGISVRDYSCQVTQGPLSGGVVTARAVWEMNKSGGRLLLGGGDIRKPDATAVLQLSEKKLEYVTTNGEVTEVRTSGRGAYLLTSGVAASLSEKTFDVTKTTAPAQFYFETKRE